jgi:hypothetical protein
MSQFFTEQKKHLLENTMIKYFETREFKKNLKKLLKKFKTLKEDIKNYLKSKN